MMFTNISQIKYVFSRTSLKTSFLMLKGGGEASLSSQRGRSVKMREHPSGSSWVERQQAAALGIDLATPHSLSATLCWIMVTSEAGWEGQTKSYQGEGEDYDVKLSWKAKKCLRLVCWTWWFVDYLSQNLNLDKHLWKVQPKRAIYERLLLY